jgi:hypothetical protein
MLLQCPHSPSRSLSGKYTTQNHHHHHQQQHKRLNPTPFKIHHPSTTHKNQLEAKRQEQQQEKNTKKQKAIIIKRTNFESNSKSKTPNTPLSKQKITITTTNSKFVRPTR